MQLQNVYPGEFLTRITIDIKDEISAHDLQIIPSNQSQRMLVASGVGVSSTEDVLISMIR